MLAIGRNIIYCMLNVLIKISLINIIIGFLVSCFPEDKKILEDNYNQLGILYLLSYAEANAETGDCPSTSDTVPLGSGKHTITLENKDIYWFNPKPMIKEENYRFGESQYWIKIEQGVGQDVNIYSVGCISYTKGKDRWIGKEGIGETEEILMWVSSRDRHYLYYLEMTEGSGTFSLILPNDKANCCNGIN